MPVPKIFRMLAGATLLMFFWLVFQIYRAPGAVDAPVKSKSALDEMIRDPNLDRESSFLLLPIRSR